MYVCLYVQSMMNEYIKCLFSPTDIKIEAGGKGTIEGVRPTTCSVVIDCTNGAKQIFVLQVVLR